MSYPDLMFTKAEALRRLQQQEHLIDPYAAAWPTRVYRRRALPHWLRRVQYNLAARLVAWGETLQTFNSAPAALSRGTTAKADCFETVK